MSANEKREIGWSGRAFHYSEEEIAAVVDAMRGADPLTQGPCQARFEKDFAAYCGVKHAFAAANCTNALDLTAILTRLGPGDEVIIPGHTFCATAIPYGRTGARIVWADIDPATRVVSAETIGRVVSPRTKVFVPVHLYGLMCDMDEIMELARQHDCLVVEDSAQAVGASYEGRKAGSWGDFGTFSFHCQKNITTLGEGGALTVRDPEMAKLVPGLRHNGVRPFGYEREHYWQPAMGNVDLDLDGVWPYNFSIGEPQCALASQVLKRLDEMNALRVRRATAFREAFSDYPELSFQYVSPAHGHVYHLLSARYDGSARGKTNHDFIGRMFHEHRIKVIVQYYPLYRYPLFQRMGFGEADCPATDDFFDNMVSFPFHLWMTDEDFDYVIACTKETLDTLRG